MEVKGEKMCSVKYLEKNERFELSVFEEGDKGKSLGFEKIDMIWIEIFEVLEW